jgi:hypothetical protein
VVTTESLWGTALQTAEKAVYFVIPSEARNLSSIETQRKRDSSARSVPRNDKIMSFTATCLAAGLFEIELSQKFIEE